MDSIHKRERKPAGESKNLMDSLQNEIALDIVSRLPISSLIQFRFVCQTWNMLTHDSRLVDLHLTRALKINPCIIFKSYHPQKEQLFFVELSDHDDDEHTLREIQIPFSASMAKFRVVGSCKGLLCLSGVYDHQAVYIYNPFSTEHKKLPHCNHELEVNEVVYGFGFHPATNDYKVIKIGYYPHVYYATWSPVNTHDHDLPRSEVHVFCLGSNTWRNLGELPYKLHHSPGVLVSGRLHWVTRFNWHLDRLIVSFDLFNDTFQEVPRPDFNVNLFHCSYHLASLRGCLCACLLTSNGENLEIWIMEEYNKKESWVKEYNIGASPIVGQDLSPQSYDIWRTSLQKATVKVMCILENGDILLDCQGGILVAYSIHEKILKIISISSMPKSCQAIAHVGSLNWIANLT
ncbi:PREDICTED: F-box protein At3g07870-like [Nicotiana attenuata]|uniref:F-box protein n=1 Tax=Nicotiana attenuata TaxID=49451 RepID=A0A1J6K5J8_NICAT|nr:PREDICTED: F-box protein At3g07870-like [Nicotiana attenuata]OIT24606.1 f-box protein [Nicotiana attenuata]